MRLWPSGSPRRRRRPAAGPGHADAARGGSVAPCSPTRWACCRGGSTGCPSLGRSPGGAVDSPRKMSLSPWPRVAPSPWGPVVFLCDVFHGLGPPPNTSRPAHCDRAAGGLERVSIPPQGVCGALGGVGAGVRSAGLDVDGSLPAPQPRAPVFPVLPVRPWKPFPWWGRPGC